MDNGSNGAAEGEAAPEIVPDSESTEPAASEEASSTVPNSEAAEPTASEEASSAVPNSEAAEPAASEEASSAASEEAQDAILPEEKLPTVYENGTILLYSDAILPEEKLPTVYENGTILLYSFEQLKLVGSGAAVTSTDADSEQLGMGEEILNEQGTAVSYGADAAYSLAQDIPMPKGEAWQLPETFTGRIAPATASDGKPLYDAKTDIIYVYHPYQLMTMQLENAQEQPVLTEDADASAFGMGQLIYPNGEENPYITYSTEHNYVLSMQFCSDCPEPIYTAQAAAPGTTEGGRDFPGQVIKTLNGKDYILIGNQEQLRSIGSNKPVYTAVYQAIKKGFTWEIYQENGKPRMLYGGDADLLASQNGKKDYQFGKDGIEKSTDGGIYIVGRCGVNQKTGEIDPNMDIENSGQTYSSSANYIIFRDIDLNNALWTPMMFNGTMIGAKSQNGEKLWDDTQITAAGRPTVSNITVRQTTPIEVNKYMGVGFFATISNQISQKLENVGVSNGTVKVENLELHNVQVHNETNKTKNTQTILNAILSGLGGIVGGLLDLLLSIITIGGVNIHMKDMLSNLLNARAKDPTRFATGGFAGRVVGDVVIKDCALTGTVDVSNINDNTGAFVGYAEGMTEYEGLSKLLGGIEKVLAALLNAIPGLGLGDLITVLLGNVLSVDKLIPTGYINPKIENCSVSGLTGTIGSDAKKYAGGFVGQQIGTLITGSAIENSSYTVKASEYAGGFAGISRDAQINGALSNLGIELLRVIQPQSLLMENKLIDSTVQVNGGNYVGGFAGALASSYAINSQMSGTMTVQASGSCAGGFAGIATLGWLSNLGKDQKSNVSLLTVIKDLLNNILTNGSPDSGMLLSLVGISPSAIMGCQMHNASVTVNAQGDYAGGVLGKGDGVYLTPSDAQYLNRLPSWKYGKFPWPQTSALNTIEGLASVSAAGKCAGGVAGSLTTASAVGVLNNALGVGSYIGFTIADVSISGVSGGYSVSAGTDNAGGAFGETIGGSIERVTLQDVLQVQAENRAGGFVGCAGPGDLAGASGIKLGLLGLELLEIKNLLQFGQGLAVTIKDSSVTGVPLAAAADGQLTGGLTVTATGQNQAGAVTQFTAAGFVAKSNSTEIQNAHVENLRAVVASDQSGYAGGFVGISQTGGLAEVADEGAIKGLLSINGLVNAVGYLIPKYENCTVSYLDGGYVQGDVAGGFVADFRSGKVDNTSRGEADGFAVYNIDHVSGQSYAGGFGGRVTSGALADAGGGLSILGGITGLKIQASDLLSVVDAYVPFVKYAGVQSDNGFTVSAPRLDTVDSACGSAGGFIGYASGAQISHCDVSSLKNTKVVAPKDMEAVDAPTYFDASEYAVMGGRYAGGFVGNLDIGSAASLGSGLKILGTTIQLTDILSALSVVTSTVEHSDVVGAPGGFAVLANGKSADGTVYGMAGGFAGNIAGGHIQNSNVKNFSYVIGQIAAGGYTGNLVPGNVANVLNNTSILGGLVKADAALASLMEDFVPTIRNSSASGIPCGGAIRAQAASSMSVQRGMAGGYVGHNEGGQIMGLSTDRWKGEKVYSGPTSLCKAERIASVYGYEYAGGYTGMMECADTASAGGLSILGGVIEVGNLLGALSVVYPTDKNTAVYGPLSNLDYLTWNQWVEYVGKYGGRGEELAVHGTVASQEELDQILGDYVYGYNVAAGRTAHETTLVSEGGDAGGYVGLMSSGVITNAQANEVKQVNGMRSVGGFAGRMRTGGAAEFGSVSILGLKLNIGALLQVAQVFVPVIKNSSVKGYQSGMTVTATGTDRVHGCGYAGGYAGSVYGGQIWGDMAGETVGCNTTNLRRVHGVNDAGGFVGMATAGTVANVNTNAGGGLLQGILNAVLRSPGDLLSVLQATVSVMRSINVQAADPEWGFVVESDQGRAGGFAGLLEAAVVGDKKGETKVSVNGLRGVSGGDYAGGFFGLADVTSVASVSGTGEDKTSILGLIKAGKVDVVDAFRTYIYHADVTGVPEGISVRANTATSEGLLDSKRYSGCAGGFGGGMMNGSIKNAAVRNLSKVDGLNYVGGFVGHLGKNGVVDADDAAVSGLLGLTAGVLDVFGAHVEQCSVEGIPSGYDVKAQNGQECIAGGFTGYADLSRVKQSTAHDAKKVYSDQIAGGFVGKTDMTYLVNLKIDSVLLDVVLKIVNELVTLLHLNDLENLGLITIQLPGDKILTVKVLGDGNVLYVNLLGLKISVALAKSADGNQVDTAIITIGDSMIRLPCTKDGIDTEAAKGEVEISLIKGNRTKIENCELHGVSLGCDVYGGGADDRTDGTNANGYAGGFAGMNHEGLLIDNQMYYCDVVRGTADQVGPFTGRTKLDSVYEFNTLFSIEGEHNVYCIYRAEDPRLSDALTMGHHLIAQAQKDQTYSTAFNRYDVTHLEVVKQYSDLKDAVLKVTGDKPTEVPLGVYESPAKVVLMSDVALGDNPDGIVPEPGEVQDPCSETGDKPTEVPLGVYESPAKVVLMSDVALGDNPDGIVPEPGEVQDPCSETVDLSLLKVWKDWYNHAARPNQITVNVFQSYTDAAGVEHKQLYQTVQLTADQDGQFGTASWRKVIKDLPVAFKEQVDGVEVLHYYTYTVEETPVEGYKTSISKDKTGYEITITNTATMPELPFSGGAGDIAFILAGFGFIALGIMWTRKRRQVQQKEGTWRYTR